MNVNLLYKDREWSSAGSYFDYNSVTKDLGLKAIFNAASTDSITRMGGTAVTSFDPYLGLSVKRVMGVPLKTKEEIGYRQEIMQDCFKKQSMTDSLYRISKTVLDEWEKLGRKNNSIGEIGTKAKLITDLKVLKLLYDGIALIKKIFSENAETLQSEGLKSLYDRLENEFSEEKTEQLEALIDSVSFFADIYGNSRELDSFSVRVPRIKIECGLMDGLKIGDLKLDELETVVMKYNKQYGIGSRVKGKISSLTPGVISLYKDQAIQEDAEAIEFLVVSHVYSYCTSFVSMLGAFFDQFHFQIAFYLGAINFKAALQNCKIEFCFPVAEDAEDCLEYDELKEPVLSMEIKGKTVGNTGRLSGKQLVVITGANQGGKSTFLRSLGVSQLLMQCGMVVPAKRFKSSIHTSVFTHFTRREDSAMNSGRLDEELRRMDRIVSNLDKDSLILLNESFATTTEKDGSRIAYGIIKALKEHGVRIYTVTHLLSFAQQTYKESASDEKVCFMCAEHLDNGKRTYKIIPHEPEMTSFGLELYDEVLGS
ncbi:MAG: hypothetical protein K5871_04300 [Lachnospiraceae bacterium]|nr:hypothetical protein [Lachnospiraceae bacterium]